MSIWTAALRRLWRLLRLLRLAAPHSVSGLVVLRLVAEVSPVGTALASGHLVAVLTHGVSRPGGQEDVLIAVSILGAVMLLARAAESLEEYFTTIVTQSINGAIRERLRTMATAQADLRIIEDPAFQAGAAHAADLGLGNGRARSPGAAAAGQTALLLRLAGGLAGTALVAWFSVPLAAALLAITLTTWVLVRRHWMRLAEVRHGGSPRQHRARYWVSLATEPEPAKELRIFGLGGWTAARYRGDGIGAMADTWRAVFRTLRKQTPIVVLSAFAAVLALGVPGVAALHGAIPASTMVTTIFAAWVIFRMSTLGNEVFDIEYGGITVRAFDDLARRYAPEAAVDASAVEAPATGPTAPGPASNGEPPPAVCFNDVTFGYPNGSGPVLDKLNLVLRPGMVTALVGSNGAGKTTLIKLLAGLYQPGAGQITVDGVSLADLDPHRWRRQLSVLFQDFVQYPESVRTNVIAGAPEARDDQFGVLAAIRRAGLAELLEKLPAGLDTPLWSGVPGGVDLSGGQWQRVALARVLFAVRHGRRIVVLDEPTAHLDVAVEADFHQQIVAAMPGVSIVLISHRLSTVRPAHTILLLSNGRIVEAGDHDALMARQGEYARLYTLQASRFIDAQQPR